MKISELNLPIYGDDEGDLEVPWDEVDSMYDPAQLQRKEENKVHPIEDDSKMTTEPEYDELATSGHRGLERFKKTL